jgi:M6 family metalloprotease-like protein
VLTFDESLSGVTPGAASFAVTVDGLAWTVSGVAASAATVTLALFPAVDAGQAVRVSYVPPSAFALEDPAGNRAAGFDVAASNASVAGPVSSAGSFSPSLAKPAFADDHSSIEPWVGEWGPKSDPQWVSSTGHLHALLVPVDFPDVPATDSPVSYRGLFAATTPPWYAESSYGRLSFDLAAVDHYVRMANPIDSYGLQNCCPSAAIHAFFQELVGKLDPTVDFSHVDAVYAIAPKAAGAHMSILLWRRWPGSGIVADGHELLNGVVGNGNYSPEIAYYLAHYAMTHETGHMMGLADQYGRACPTCVDTHDWVGVWSMMDTSDRTSAEFLGWDKWLLGWLDPSQVRGLSAPGSLEAVVSPLEEPGGVKLVVVPTSSTFLYAVEVRQPIGQDIRLCDHGVLVYTVDASKMNGSGPIHVQPAHTDAPCGPISDAAYDLGAGEVAAFEDSHVKVELLSAYADGAYGVRVTRK